MLWQLTGTFTNPTIAPGDFNDLLLLFVKIMFLVGSGLYVGFGIIVIRQIRIMRQTLITPFSGTLRVLGYTHLALTIIVFFFLLILL